MRRIGLSNWAYWWVLAYGLWGCSVVSESSTQEGAVHTNRQALAVDTQASFGRRLADVNGDGRADLVWRHGSYIWVALATQTGFAAGSPWSYWDTRYDFQLADVDGDEQHRADIVGRSGNDVQVGLSTGQSFAASTQWTTWNPAYDYQLADVDGDAQHRADIVGRSGNDVQVGLSTGQSFAPSTQWTTWNPAYDYQLADVDGDVRHRADIVGRSGNDVQVGLSTGQGFAPSTQWTTWNPAYDYQLADVDGDSLHRADMVGRSMTDIQVGLSTGSGFATSSQWAVGDAPYAYYLGMVSRDRLQSYVDGLCAFRSREPVFTDHRGAFANNLAAAADYIERQFRSMGYVVTREPVYYYSSYCLADGYCGDNVVATKPGTTYSDSYIEFTGHYDGGFGGDDTYGAKDNATAVATVLELAGVLAGYANRHSMRFIAFAAEEIYLDGPGSSTHVARALEAGQTIVAALNEDLVGTSTEAGSYTTIWYRDAASLGLARFFAATAKANGVPLRVLTEDIGLECQSDERPYANAHLQAITSLGDWKHSGFHTAADNPANVDYNNVYWMTQTNLGVGLALDVETTF